MRYIKPELEIMKFGIEICTATDTVAASNLEADANNGDGQTGEKNTSLVFG